MTKKAGQSPLFKTEDNYDKINMTIIYKDKYQLCKTPMNKRFNYKYKVL